LKNRHVSNVTDVTDSWETLKCISECEENTVTVRYSVTPWLAATPSDWFFSAAFRWVDLGTLLIIKQDTQMAKTRAVPRLLLALGVSGQQ
jgi:hypothetical protein